MPESINHLSSIDQDVLCRVSDPDIDCVSSFGFFLVELVDKLEDGDSGIATNDLPCELVMAVVQTLNLSRYSQSDVTQLRLALTDDLAHEIRSSPSYLAEMIMSSSMSLRFRVPLDQLFGALQSRRMFFTLIQHLLFTAPSIKQSRCVHWPHYYDRDLYNYLLLRGLKTIVLEEFWSRSRSSIKKDRLKLINKTGTDETADAAYRGSMMSPIHVLANFEHRGEASLFFLTYLRLKGDDARGVDLRRFVEAFELLEEIVEWGNSFFPVFRQERAANNPLTINHAFSLVYTYANGKGNAPRLGHSDTPRLAYVFHPDQRGATQNPFLESMPSLLAQLQD